MTDRDRPSRDRTCTATCADGTACAATARPDAEVCAFHDPDLADVRAEARRRGGRHSSTTARALASMPEPIGDTIDRVTTALDEVHAGDLPASRGRAVASLARALVALWDTHATERRLDELEGELARVHRPSLRPPA